MRATVEAATDPACGETRERAGRSMRAVFAVMRRRWSSRPLRLRVVPNFGERCCRPEGLLFQGRHNEGVERGEQGVGSLVVVVVCAAVGAGAGPACVLVDASRDDHGRHTRMSAAMRMSTAATTAGINHDGECGVTFGFADCVMADGATDRAGVGVGAGDVVGVHQGAARRHHRGVIGTQSKMPE